MKHVTLSVHENHEKFLRNYPKESWNSNLECAHVALKDCLKWAYPCFTAFVEGDFFTCGKGNAESWNSLNIIMQSFGCSQVIREKLMLFMTAKKQLLQFMTSLKTFLNVSKAMFYAFSA